MAVTDQVVQAKTLRDSITGEDTLLAVSRDSETDICTLEVQAVGVTFDGTLDPTNLALEAGHLATIDATLTLLSKKLAMVPGTALVRTFTAVTAQSAQVGSTVFLIVATQDCHIVVGANPTATTNDTFVPAKVPTLFQCLTTDKVAVIRSSADGIAYITPAA